MPSKYSKNKIKVDVSKTRSVHNLILHVAVDIGNYCRNMMS